LISTFKKFINLHLKSAILYIYYFVFIKNCIRY